MLAVRVELVFLALLIAAAGDSGPGLLNQSFKA
jgi:hypothetical protein